MNQMKKMAPCQSNLGSTPPDSFYFYLKESVKENKMIKDNQQNEPLITTIGEIPCRKNFLAWVLLCKVCKPVSVAGTK